LYYILMAVMVDYIFSTTTISDHQEPMTFEEATREAARAAANAVTKGLDHVRTGHVVDEDDLTGVLVGRISGALDGRRYARLCNIGRISRARNRTHLIG
jgi:hypothetical protein